MVAELYAVDEGVIGAALGRGEVVVKDGDDTAVVARLAFWLVRSGVVPVERRAYRWVGVLLSRRRYGATVMVFVDAPARVRRARIRVRGRALGEVEGAVRVWQERLRRQVMADHQGLVLAVDGGLGVRRESVARVVDHVVALVNRAAAGGGGTR
ncbi:hypothetical protein [Actinokineospora sp. NBRC 105648]|uniref:hypothetical protein n=1 Tax=Actinokineospora sp. NBRC 105648 TaxID=3032206 RepID=UPI0025571871|nr:hypothetical protein [Actinokineospora sp. NBRC 105648]